MSAQFQRILLSIAGTVAAMDCFWASIHRFDVDVGAYAGIGALSIAFALGALFYMRVRKEENLAAMLFGTAFLVWFSAASGMLNYFLLTVAGARIDAQLAAIDRAMGIDWPAMMAIVTHHPLANRALELAYDSTLPQIAALVVCLGCSGKPVGIYKLCLGVAISAAITVAFWTLFPSFGAFSVYQLPANVASRLSVALNSRYAQSLIDLLANGPGRISPDEVKGLIGFPSYHAAMAVLVVWYVRPLVRLRWPVAGFNAVVLFSTPIQGGHDVIDVIAGMAVAALAIAAVESIATRVGHTSEAADREHPGGAALPAE